MAQALIHNELEIAYPDGFAEMSPEELRQAYNNPYPNIWGIRDTERHVILAVFWKDSSELASKFASAESLAKRAEKQLSKGMRKNAYRFGGAFVTTIAGCEAHGFRYSFTAVGNVAQEAETIVFKRGKTCYTLYYYTRPETVASNLPVHDAILAAIRFA
ncbi:MAG: hypothetical protein Q4C36_10385 [Coriobacteriia bacterium]|nr:hypothetical protein [Coriobacteriia bacterium]